MDQEGIQVAAMPQKAVNVVTRPTDFFQSMPKTGGFGEPLVFAVVMGVISGIIQAILNVAGWGAAAGYGAGMRSGFGIVIFMPIAAAVGSFIGAAILFVIWKLMGSQENYETAYRCGAYLMALSPITTLIGAVPYAGGIVTIAIYVYYLVIASVCVHHLPSQKAWLVFGIIGAIFALMGLSGEYKIRHMSLGMQPWLQAGEDIRRDDQNQAQALQQSADEMRKQAEAMARQFQQQAEQAKMPNR